MDRRGAAGWRHETTSRPYLRLLKRDSCCGSHTSPLHMPPARPRPRSYSKGSFVVAFTQAAPLQRRATSAMNVKLVLGGTGSLCHGVGRGSIGTLDDHQRGPDASRQPDSANSEYVNRSAICKRARYLSRASGQTRVDATRTDLPNRRDDSYDLIEVRETARPGFVMAIVRRLPRQWWILLATFAGSVLATTNASAREMGGDCGCADQTCSRPWADPFAIPNAAGGFGTDPRSDGVQDTRPRREQSRPPHLRRPVRRPFDSAARQKSPPDFRRRGLERPHGRRRRHQCASAGLDARQAPYEGPTPRGRRLAT